MTLMLTKKNVTIITNNETIQYFRKSLYLPADGKNGFRKQGKKSRFQ